jgi:hypothetical protein
MLFPQKKTKQPPKESYNIKWPVDLPSGDHATQCCFHQKKKKKKKTTKKLS